MSATQSRGERTRETITAAAQELLIEHGYAGTTMRAVAERAGVSLGNAYYYFDSKDALVQSFYERLQHRHAELTRVAIADEADFTTRLHTTLIGWLDLATELHPFLRSFFRVASDPDSPLSPFSSDSTPAREQAYDLYRDVADNTDLKLAARLSERLPELLWLVHMGVVLFWVHDSTPDQQRTRTLVDRLAPLLTKLLRLTRLPGVRQLSNEVIDLIDAVRR